MTKRISTGVAGLDDVLVGGVIPSRIYMVCGQPGTGKTTLAMQFVLAGVNQGESVLFVTLGGCLKLLRSARLKQESQPKLRRAGDFCVAHISSIQNG